jgi:hypothetical protein
LAYHASEVLRNLQQALGGPIDEQVTKIKREEDPLAVMRREWLNLLPLLLSKWNADHERLTKPSYKCEFAANSRKSQTVLKSL